MNKLAKIYFVSCLISFFFFAIGYFVIWLLGQSGNRVCRAFWQNICSQYYMSFLVIARPWLSQESYDRQIKSQQDKFANSFLELLRALGVVEMAKKEGVVR